jgi:rubrerythrin
MDSENTTHRRQRTDGAADPAAGGPPDPVSDRGADADADTDTDSDTDAKPNSESESTGEMNRDRSHDRQVDTITGPHTGRDRYGRVDHYFWRCVNCGLETTDPDVRDGCPRCAAAASRPEGQRVDDPDRPRADGGRLDVPALDAGRRAHGQGGRHRA